jgi:hypothetical protein
LFRLSPILDVYIINKATTSAIVSPNILFPCAGGLLIACQRNKPQSCSHAVMQLFRYILGYTTPISLIMKAATRQKISPIHNLPNGVLAYIISYMKGELCKVIFNLQALASRRIHFM